MITKNKPHAHASPVSFAYHESHHDSYSQFPQSPLGNLGPQPSLCVLNTKERNDLQIISLAAYASETNNIGAVLGVVTSQGNQYR